MLSYFDESILNGYDSCPDLQDDLDEAVGIIANTTIENLSKSHFRSDYSDMVSAKRRWDGWNTLRIYGA